MKTISHNCLSVLSQGKTVRQAERTLRIVLMGGIVCELQTSTVRSELGCCAAGKKKTPVSYKENTLAK